MIINNLPELYDSTSYITATRDKWPEGVFVFGLNARVIENKDVESTLVFDAVVSKYLNIHGHDTLTLCKALYICDEVGRIRPWIMNQEDMHADDWLMTDHTELIQNKPE